MNTVYKINTRELNLSQKNIPVFSQKIIIIKLILLSNIKMNSVCMLHADHYELPSPSPF